MRVICRGGKSLQVDDSKLDYENDYIPCVQQVTMISDDVGLTDKWLVTGYKNKGYWVNGRSEPLEYADEKVFDEKPSDDEIISFMSERGLGVHDGCTVEQLKVFDFQRD